MLAGRAFYFLPDPKRAIACLQLLQREFLLLDGRANNEERSLQDRRVFIAVDLPDRTEKAEFFG